MLSALKSCERTAGGGDELFVGMAASAEEEWLIPILMSDVAVVVMVLVDKDCEGGGDTGVRGGSLNKAA